MEGHGKYFVMVDSDDFLAREHLEKLVSFAEENVLDIAACGAYGFTPDDILSILRSPKRELVYTIEENEKYFLEMYPFLRTIWGKIIRRDLLEKADFTIYRKNAQDYVAEDTAFVLAVYEQGTRFGLITDNLLYYRQNNNSVSERYNKNYVEDSGNIYCLSKGILERLNGLNELNHEFIRYIF